MPSYFPPEREEKKRRKWAALPRAKCGRVFRTAKRVYRDDSRAYRKGCTARLMNRKLTASKRFISFRMPASSPRMRIHGVTKSVRGILRYPTTIHRSRRIARTRTFVNAVHSRFDARRTSHNAPRTTHFTKRTFARRENTNARDYIGERRETARANRPESQI